MRGLMKLVGAHGSITLGPRRNSRVTLPGLLPAAITPAVGRPARCTVTLPGSTGSVGDVVAHRGRARLRSPPESALTDGHQREMPTEHSPPSSRTRANHPVARLPLSRYGAGKHPLRRDAPVQKGCNAYRSGAPPHRHQACARVASLEPPTPASDRPRPCSAAPDTAAMH